MKAIPIVVTFPSGVSQINRSIRATARMLSGTGRASGGLRKTISRKAANGLLSEGDNIVRNNALVG